MRPCLRSLLVLAALAVAAPAAAQTAPAPAPDIVARVDRSPVTKAAFDHWMLVAAASLHPRHAAVVPAEGTKSWKTLRTQVMIFLLDSRWIQEEAARREIAVSPAAVHREFAKDERESFPLRRDFRRFLRMTRMTVADLTYRVKIDMLSRRIRAQAVRGVKGASARARAAAAAVADMDSRWHPLTTCVDAYRVSECGPAMAATPAS